MSFLPRHRFLHRLLPDRERAAAPEDDGERDGAARAAAPLLLFGRPPVSTEPSAASAFRRSSAVVRATPFPSITASIGQQFIKRTLRPTRFPRNREWPTMVMCRSERPSSQRQKRAQARSAETPAFVVAALPASKVMFPKHGRPATPRSLRSDSMSLVLFSGADEPSSQRSGVAIIAGGADRPPRGLKRMHAVWMARDSVETQTSSGLSSLGPKSFACF